MAFPLNSFNDCHLYRAIIKRLKVTKRERNEYKRFLIFELPEELIAQTHWNNVMPLNSWSLIP